MIPFLPRRSQDPHNDKEVVSGLIKAGLSPLVAHAMMLRGVGRADVALGQHALLPYHSLKGMARMASSISSAIQKKEKIIIVADYDCDGATACAIGVSGLRAMGADIDFVVPNRFVHGYGLTPEIVDEVEKEKRPQWILTVDNGIASVEGVERAIELGIKVLVTDHHLPGEKLPRAEAIVNPNQPGCDFPSKNLAGCGVMYYVLAATREELRAAGMLADGGPNLAEWLDLVALGTVADVVLLDDNNRWMVRQGLRRIRQGKMRPGIQALFDVANRQTCNATAQDFGFSLGPRVNAAGRLEDMSIGIRCLLSDTYEKALEEARTLEELNIRRKSIEHEMKDAALEQLDWRQPSSSLTRVFFDPGFHEGVVGVVAGRIKEGSGCPTVVFARAREEGMIKGSGRSIPELHLRDALDVIHKEAPLLLHKFGGHAMAAGLTIREEDLPEFKAAFERSVARMLSFKSFQKVVETDGDVDPAQMTYENAQALVSEIWGQGFPEPVWTGVFEVVESRIMGVERNHTKMTVRMGGETWDALHFFNTEAPPPGARLEIAFKMGVNEFRGESRMQLLVVEKKEALQLEYTAASTSAPR